MELGECAGRAGLAITAAKIDPAQIKASMLPALIIGDAGDAVAVLHRNGEKVECALPGIEGSHWMPLEQLLRDHPGHWFFVRPVFHFDVRSLIYHLPQPRRWFWDVFKANRSIYQWALLGTVVINLLAIVLPFYTMAVYDRVVPNNALDSLWVLTTAAVAVTLFDLLIKVRSYLLKRRHARLTACSHIFAHSLRLRAPVGRFGRRAGHVVRISNGAGSHHADPAGRFAVMLLFLASSPLGGNWCWCRWPFCPHAGRIVAAAHCEQNHQRQHEGKHPTHRPPVRSDEHLDTVLV